VNSWYPINDSQTVNGATIAAASVSAGVGVEDPDSIEIRISSSAGTTAKRAARGMLNATVYPFVDI
jgi:hypothetical protein